MDEQSAIGLETTSCRERPPSSGLDSIFFDNRSILTTVNTMIHGNAVLGLQQYFHRLIVGALAANFLGLIAPWVSAQLPERENGHRPLRGNPVAEPPDAEPHGSFIGYRDAPDFKVVPRIEKLNHFPCSNCHAAMEVNSERRELRAPTPPDWTTVMGVYGALIVMTRISGTVW